MILNGIKVTDIAQLEELISGYDEQNKQYLRNDFNGISNIVEMTDSDKFIYNNDFYVNKNDDFSAWASFFLNPEAEINDRGDKSRIIWKTNDEEIAIIEEPTYIRYKVGEGLLAKLFLKRELTVKYFRKNGTFESHILPVRIYNENDRVMADKKSRSSIIELVRKNTAGFIYQVNMIAQTPEKITPQLLEALKLFDSLQKFITLYREEREHKPLVQALQAVVPNENLSQETINFIINGVNIDYYAN